MDKLTFIVEILKALSWPVVFIVISSMFRSELRELLRKIKKGKVGLAEFEFEKAVADLKGEASSKKFLPANMVDMSAVRLAKIEPRTAILDAWLEVQNEVYRIVDENRAVDNNISLNSKSLRVLHRVLSKQPEYIDRYNELKMLRNQAVHEVDFSPRTESVISYIQLAKELVGVLKNI